MRASGSLHVSPYLISVSGGDLQNCGADFRGFGNVGDDVGRLLKDGRIVVDVFHVDRQVMGSAFLGK